MLISPRALPERQIYREEQAVTVMMRAARMHEVGGPMRIEEIARPSPTGTDILVEVKACGMVPNLGNVLANWPTWCPHLPLPELPAIFGLDPAGVVAEVGEQVIGLKPGDRVYVSPVRSCGACPRCLAGERTQCAYMTFNGYFGFQPQSQVLYDMYPYGGFSEYMTAPQYAAIKIPDSMSFDAAARLGYWGTAYAATKKAGGLTGKTLLIAGVSGTLGVGLTLLALASGVKRIYGVARNPALLEQVRALAPERIEVFESTGGSIAEWARSRTGHGVDVVIDTLGAAASLETLDDAMHAVRRGGTIVTIGGTVGKLPIDVKWIMDEQISLIGSVWFTGVEGHELVSLIESGAVDISVLRTQAYPLSEVNAAIGGVVGPNGGFTNYVVNP